MEKQFAIGIENFETIIDGGYYYADKTSFIRPVLTSGSYVQLITRPRRFGKSLFLETLREFLEISAAHPGDASRQKRLFHGLNVLEDEAFCKRFMGQHPVLHVSFHAVAGEDFNAARAALADAFQEIAAKNACLLSSPRLNEEDKSFLRDCSSRKYLRNAENLQDLKGFLKQMLMMMAKHFERQAVLLIDEYDVPLKHAAVKGYYNAMVDLMRSELAFLKSGGTLLNNKPAVMKAILMGCLRVSKESIFTGLNNLDVNSVCSENEFLAECIGFTPTDVDRLLACCGLSSRRGIVKQWYDGYRFAGKDIYCPWDVINFCASALRKRSNPLAYEPQNFWLNTSGNDIILPFIDYLTKTDSDMMQALIDGKAIEVELNEQVTYADMAGHRSEDFWTLLLFSGYLTIISRSSGKYWMRIPNEEVRDSFEKRISWLFSGGNASFAPHGIDFARAALAGDANGMSNILFDVLTDYVSVRDSASRAPAENYYHGLLTGLLACVPKNSIAFFESNREAGDGYADITFTSARLPRAGVVIELKKAASENALESTAQEALEQIQQRHYVQGLKHKLCSRIFSYGIAFHKKSCIVLSRKEDPEEPRS